MRRPSSLKLGSHSEFVCDTRALSQLLLNLLDPAARLLNVRVLLNDLPLLLLQVLSAEILSLLRVLSLQSVLLST